MAESGTLNSQYFKHQEALALLEATFPYNHPKCVSKHVKIESDTELQHNLSCQQLCTKIHRVVLACISLKVNSKIIYMCKHGPWDNSAQVPVSRKALHLFGPGGKFSKILKSKPVEQYHSSAVPSSQTGQFCFVNG